jgi:hypothetical protein
MPEGPHEKDKAPKLSERIATYLEQVEFLVRQGGEQPQFEFKRSVSLARENLSDRYDFIKFLQGVANAEIFGERCVVVGADPKEKKFHAVTNVEEFDPAKVSQILAAYLDPMPKFEVFNVTTAAGDALVLIVLDANQPRPVMVVKQGQTQDGKIRLEVGDTWIKRDTDLVRATNADLALMYAARIEKEAEDRARKRLKHLLELSPTLQASPLPSLRVPEATLLVGPKNDLRSFAKELIAAGEVRRFRMLLELARESLVDGWDEVRGQSRPGDIEKFTADLVSGFRDEFFPSLQAVVELGLLIVKNEGEDEWFAAVIDVLIDAFEASRGLNWLKSSYMLQRPDLLPWWKPAFDIYTGIRTIAAYAVLRNRLKYLGSILPRAVSPITIDDRVLDKSPILFWPFGDVPFPEGWHIQGRAAFLWKERVAGAWGEYFGTAAKFSNSSAQLELLLEFNSAIGNNGLEHPKLQKWIDQNIKDTTFRYVPDLYSQDLRVTVPMAERLYDAIASPNSRFPSYLAVDVRLFDQLFKETQPAERLAMYGKFLSELKTWQTHIMFQHNRFPFMFSWDGRLKALVDEHTARLKGPK